MEREAWCVKSQEAISPLGVSPWNPRLFTDEWMAELVPR
jgi:hypothetical protein